MKKPKNPEIVSIMNTAVKSGNWKIETSSKRAKHSKLRHVSGRMVTIPLTPSDRRAPLNFQMDIRYVEAGHPGWGMGNCIMQSLPPKN
jgi:hypothetical protein